jgi:hypothetical protein
MAHMEKKIKNRYLVKKLLTALVQGTIDLKDKVRLGQRSQTRERYLCGPQPLS